MKHTDLERARLCKIIQRLKSLILRDLDAVARNQIKDELRDLDEKYTKKQIEISTYKQTALVLLLKYWHDVPRCEQFLYKEATKLLNQAEIFQICELLQNIQD